jgi:hypothetical protein
VTPRRFDVLIPTIPHRHQKLCVLLAELDRQMRPGVGAIVWQDNLQAEYGDKCSQLLGGSDAEYVAFLDDDDWIHPDYLTRIMTALGSGPDYVGFECLYTIDGVVQPPIYHSLQQRAGRTTGIVHKNPIRRELALLGRWAGGWAADGRWAADVAATGLVQTEVWIPEAMYMFRWSSGDNFNSARQPLPGGLAELPRYDWLREL